MSETIDRSQTLEGRLWDALEAKGVGLLSLTKSGLHPQPAVVFLDRRGRRLWFAALAASELVQGLGDGGAAMFCVQGRGVLASVGGNLTRVIDRRRLERLWTPSAWDWRPEGPSDPALALLRMDCVDAEVSLADAGMMSFSWELARPRFRGKLARPAIGYQPTLH